MRFQADLHRLDRHTDLIRKELHEAKALEYSLRMAADGAMDEESRKLLTQQLRIAAQIREHIEGRLAWTENALEKLRRAVKEAQGKLSAAVDNAKRAFDP